MRVREGDPPGGNGHKNRTGWTVDKTIKVDDLVKWGLLIAAIIGAFFRLESNIVGLDNKIDSLNNRLTQYIQNHDKNVESMKENFDLKLQNLKDKIK